MLNKVVLIGRITRDIELKKGANDNSFAPFTLAVNRQFSSAEGEKEADFINCITFNKQADNLHKYCGKGSLIAVSGRLQQRTYQAQDGTNKSVIEVVADNVVFLESKSKATEEVEPTPYDIPNTKAKNSPF